MTAPTFESLLARGYFPEVLPPCFTTTSFGLFAAANPTFFSSFETNPSRLKAIDYSASKSGYRRRTFVVTHPVAQYFVAKFIVDKWATIEAKFQTSNFSASVPEAGEAAGRSIQITPFHELHRITHERLGQFGFVAKSDIQRYYPSIYTHSIPWAIHGKAAAKKDSNANSSAVFLISSISAFEEGRTGKPLGFL